MIVLPRSTIFIIQQHVIHEEGENMMHSGRKKNLLSMCINYNVISRCLEKHPKLQSYDGTVYPNKHVKHESNRLDFNHAKGAVKCKLFTLTLIRATMTWFKTFEMGAYISGKAFVLLHRHVHSFTTMIMVILNGVTQ